MSARRDSAGYRGMGSRGGDKVFWRSADGTFEAAICSTIEANGAKLNCANPCTVGCSDLVWNKQQG